MYLNHALNEDGEGEPLDDEEIIIENYDNDFGL